MDIVKEILDIINDEIFQHSIITTDKLCFEEAVREACEKNYCGCYNKCWTCPPACGEIDKLQKKLTSYKNMFIFTTVHTLEDSFDLDGMRSAHISHDKTVDKIKELCQKHGATLLGAGSCTICEKCAFPDAPCRFPEKAIVSMEACGINVMTLSKSAGINYINGTDTVTYFSAVLYN